MINEVDIHRPALQRMSVKDMTSQRIEILRKITQGLQEKRGFSYLRLGDMELLFMLRVQSGDLKKDGWVFFDRDNLRPSINTFVSGAALQPEHYARLLQSYEQCSFLDLYQCQRFNQENIPQLRLKLLPSQIRTTNPDDSGLLYDWLLTQFPRFVQERSVLICGAECDLLKSLLSFPEYRSLVGNFIPEGARLHLLQPRNNGRTLSKDLDSIKEDLKREIDTHQPQAIILCLGGYAKILGHELANETGIPTFDGGSILRALTYSGSSGNAVWRANHNPFLFRISLPLYMDALDKAHPELKAEDILVKAHAQLCLNLMRKEVGRYFPADHFNSGSLCLTEENVNYFWQDYNYYKKNIRPLGRSNSQTQALIREFDQWLMRRGMGLSGRVYNTMERWDGRLRQFGLYRSAKRVLGGGRSLRHLLVGKASKQSDFYCAKNE